MQENAEVRNNIVMAIAEGANRNIKKLLMVCNIKLPQEPKSPHSPRTPTKSPKSKKKSRKSKKRKSKSRSNSINEEGGDCNTMPFLLIVKK